MVRTAFKAEGIKLREHLFRESDVSLRVFTREKGTLKANAPGLKRSRKRFPGSIRKFCFYEFEFSRGKGEYYLISGARFIEGYEEIGKDFKTYCAADYILQVIQYFYPENVSSPFIFDSLRNFLITLTDERDLPSALKWMEIRILNDSGFLSRFTKCTGCKVSFQGSDKLYYNCKTGQVFCKDCKKVGKFLIFNNKIRKNIESALGYTCREYRITSQRDTDLYNKIITEVIVEKLGFFPKALVEIIAKPIQRS